MPDGREPVSTAAGREAAGTTDHSTAPSPAPGRWRALALLATAELLAMTLWFSATAAGPELAAEWGLTPSGTAWLTNAVQLGFVAGALLSAGLTLSDAVRPKHLFAASALAGAAATATIAAAVNSLLPAVALRFLVGMALAGVYPPGMKLMAGWFREGRGFAIGTLVGALTVGSAAPHLIRAAGGVGEPRVVLYGAAGLAVLGGLLALLVEPGPFQSPAAPFDPGAVGRLVRDRPAMLANGGYFGHMWELYAVWTWIPVYLAAGFASGGADATGGAEATGGVGLSSGAEAAGSVDPAGLAGLDPSGLASLLAFATIAAGAVGAVAAGLLADRLGRTTVTSVAMVTSGACCLFAGLLFGGPLVLLVPFLLVWGVAIVADSAQFSAAVSELAEPGYVGTALTLQTAVGFLLTTVSIQLIPVLEGLVGWRWAFAPLAVGPVLGTLSMLRLRALPAARKLAGGRG